MSPKKTNDLIKEIAGKYASLSKDLDSKHEVLSQIKDQFPESYDPKADLESSLLLAGSAKHKAIQLWRAAMKAHGMILKDCEYFTAELKLNTSEEALKDKGFTRITDTLRDTFVSNHGGLLELTLISEELRSHSKCAEALARAFEGDENNFRRILDIRARVERM